MQEGEGAKARRGTRFRDGVRKGLGEGEGEEGPMGMKQKDETQEGKRERKGTAAFYDWAHWTWGPLPSSSVSIASSPCWCAPPEPSPDFVLRSLGSTIATSST